MTPGSHTLYSTALFLALASLLMWSNRRHRVSRMYREGLSTYIKGEEPDIG
jgi:hypothetical protein